MESNTETLSPEASWYLHEMRLKALEDYESGLYSAWKEGFEEGYSVEYPKAYAEGDEEGCAEERIKLARRLLQNNYSIDAIQKLLGLSDEEPKKLLSQPEN